MKTDNWPKDERIDWILFRAQLENVEFGDRVLKFEFTNPQVYTGECTNAIFSLLKKEYDTPRKARARGYCASQTDASAVEARPEQFAKPGETLCATCDPVGALDGSTFE